MYVWMYVLYMCGCMYYVRVGVCMCIYIHDYVGVGECVGFGVCIRLRMTQWCISVCVYVSVHACAYMCVNACGHVTFGDDHCKGDSH